MNLIKIIENIEIERDNNKKLGEAVGQRLRSMLADAQAMHSQVAAFSSHINEQIGVINQALAVVEKEFSDRDAALVALIGVDA